MKLILCIDDNGGMAFNHRRQTRDSIQRRHLRGLLQGETLRMEMYSEKLFLPDLDGVNCILLDSISCKNEDTDKSQYVLLETQDPASFLKNAEELHIYRWNREYLSDIFFPLQELEKPCWKRIKREEFKGSSHDCITYEVYVR